MGIVRGDGLRPRRRPGGGRPRAVPPAVGPPDLRHRPARVVAAVTTVLDPEAVVMGGGVGGELDLLREPMEARLQQLTPFRPRIVASELGDDAVLLGAISSAIEAVRDQMLQRRPPSEMGGVPPRRAGTGELRQEPTTSSRPTAVSAPAAAPRVPAAPPRVATTSSGGGHRLRR